MSRWTFFIRSFTKLLAWLLDFRIFHRISSLFLHIIMDAFTTIISAVAYISSPSDQPLASAAVEELPQISTVDADNRSGSCGSCIIA
ncbi:hypothetical protein C8R45DRAFT_1211771 [Mycena sanguinolenta]|nr:hypothetical protein C8R45DRAFT_1211771 [Mycena sanguinolenta]